MLSVGITDDMQCGGTARASEGGAMLDEGASDAPALRGRVNEEPVEFGVTVRAKFEGCEAYDGVA